MIMNVFRTTEPISWMLWPKWATKHRNKQGLQYRIQTLRYGGGAVIQTLRTSVWSKNNGGPGPRAPPGDPPKAYPFRVKHCSPHVRESKKVLDSGFHTVDSWFQVLYSSLFQWNLDSGFQSLVVFRIPWAVLRIHTQKFPRLRGATWSSNCSLQVKLWNPFTPCMTKMQVTGAGIYSVYITKQHRSASGRLTIIPHSNTSAKVLFLVSTIQ